MDWGTIILAGLGAALGSLLALPVRNQTARMVIAVALVVIGANLGGRYGPELLGPSLGGIIRDTTGQTDEVDTALAELGSDPFFAALLETGAVEEDEIRARLREAYRAGGVDGLENEAARIGQDLGATLVADYFPRARDEDLLATVRATSDLIAHLAERDALLCHAWTMGTPFDVARFRSLVGAEREAALQESFVSLIRNVLPEVPEVDLAAAQRVIFAASAAAQGTLSPEAISVFIGQRPPADAAEARAVCLAFHTLFVHILAAETPANTLRVLYLRAGGG